LGRVLVGWLLPTLAVLAMLVATKPWVFAIPASFDESWSVIPAAESLATRGTTDIPGYPVAHDTSSVTYLWAAVFASVPDPLPVIHLLHLAMAAISVAATWHLARPGLSTTEATIVAATVAAVPVFNAQTGFMYLEIPLVLSALLAGISFARGRPGLASLTALVGASIKPSGVVIAAALVAASVAVDRRAGIKPAVVMGLPGVVLALWAVLGSGRTVPDLGQSTGSLVGLSLWVLVSSPELMAIILGATLGAASLIASKKAPEAGSTGRRAWAFSVSLVALFATFHVALPLVGFPLSLLPRYVTVVVPFAAVAPAVFLTRRVQQPFALIGIAGLGILALIALAGAFRVGSPEVNSITSEATNDYRHLILLNDDALAFAADSGLPTFVHPNLHYRGTLPANGFTQVDPSLLVRATGREVLGDLPDRFLLIDSEQVDVMPQRRLLTAVRASGDWECSATTLERGPYAMPIHDCRRVAAP
jgi:hypothetical protein